MHEIENILFRRWGTRPRSATGFDPWQFLPWYTDLFVKKNSIWFLLPSVSLFLLLFFCRSSISVSVWCLFVSVCLSLSCLTLMTWYILPEIYHEERRRSSRLSDRTETVHQSSCSGVSPNHTEKYQIVQYQHLVCLFSRRSGLNVP